MEMKDGAMNSRNDAEKEGFFNWTYWKTSLTLAVFKALAVVPTQPMQVLMRMQQGALRTQKSRLTAVGAIKQIIENNKTPSVIKSTTNIIHSFFRGTTAGASKEFIKNLVYKNLLLVGVPKFVDRMMSPAFSNNLSESQYRFVKAVLAGTAAGLLEGVLGCPFESVAVFRALSQGKHANAQLFEKKIAWNFHKPILTIQAMIGQIPNLYQVLYRGFAPTVVKGSIAFTTYFACAEPISNLVNGWHGIENADSAWSKLAKAISVGGAVALASSIPDIHKTGTQMPKGVKEAMKQSAFQAFKSNFETFGVRGLTAGLPIKILMITIGWGLNFFVTGGTSHHQKSSSNQQTNSSENKRWVKN